MKKITQLTPEQKRRLIEHREEWLKIGLCCDPADFEAGDDVIRGFYKRLGRRDPLILHFSSPAMCELAVNFVFAATAERSQLGSQLYSQLYSQLGSQLYSQLYSQLDSQLDEIKPFFLHNRWGGQHWCSWEAFYIFGHEIGIEYRAEDVALLLEWGRLSKSVGWWAPWDGICFVSDRPREIHFDAEKRLHNEAGPAVRYSDGWGTHAWHGQRVPSEWIEDRASLTAATALTWKNIEQRRAACEILGWGEILNALDAHTIDADDDPEIGTLVEVTIPDVGRERFLRVRCGTSREFALPVPPDVPTALAAQAWTWGMDQADFTRPEIRT